MARLSRRYYPCISTHVTQRLYVKLYLDNADKLTTSIVICQLSLRGCDESLIQRGRL